MQWSVFKLFHITRFTQIRCLNFFAKWRMCNLLLYKLFHTKRTERFSETPYFKHDVHFFHQETTYRKYIPFNQDFTFRHRRVFPPCPIVHVQQSEFSYLCPKWSIRLLEALPDLGLIARPPWVHIIHILKKTRIFGQKFVLLALFKSWKLEIFKLLLFFFVLFVIFPAASFNLFGTKEMKESWVDATPLRYRKNTHIFCQWHIASTPSKILTGMCNNDKHGLYLSAAACWYIRTIDHDWHWIYQMTEIFE